MPPAEKCENGKWKWGSTGECKYDTQQDAINDNATYRDMTNVNQAGYDNAVRLINNGDVDIDGEWSFDAEDGNKILGDDNWSEYGKWFLAFDNEKNEDTKSYYGYPFGKNGKVYRKGLTAIRQRAGQMGLDDVFEAAGRLVEMIDEDKKSINNIWEEKYNNSMEKRIFNIETKSEESESGQKVIVGHASMYGARSENLGGFYEYIEEGAFTRELIAKSDVRALINHDQNLILARTTSGTLRLDADATGLQYEFDVPETSYGKDLVISMDRGDITQSSFAFTVKEDDWSTDEDGNNIRTIKKIDRLYDVSPVTYPAYPETNDLVVAQRGLAKYKEKQEKITQELDQIEADLSETCERDLVKRSLAKLKIELIKRK